MRAKRIISVFLAASIPLLFIPYFFASAASVNRPEMKTASSTVEVFNTKISQKSEMTLFDYICGVLAAEMPALYHEEALKAQAVAAFTYSLRRMNSSAESHDGASVCTSSSHCSAFLTVEEQKNRWGVDFEKYRKKIEAAVTEVLGKAICYNGKPIDALYFARSSGKTEDASEVWGNSVPYLVSVDSSVDKSGDGFEKEISYTEAEFKEIIKAAYPDVKFTKNNAEITERTASNGVRKAEIFGVTLSGKELRSKFKLSSTDFEVNLANGVLTFICKGKGHRVGMSQYGANVMAQMGYDWQEIIKHYYTGVTIEEYRIK